MLALLLASMLTLVELNCENLFDTIDNPLKADEEFLPEGSHQWTRTRYWRKLEQLAKELVALGGNDRGEWQLPDLVALCEVESDTVMHDLTRRSLLRSAGYDYVMTHSPDARGINVALVYSPMMFRPIQCRDIRIPRRPQWRPTRDVLYVKGVYGLDDTLHVFVVHAPSRTGGERATRPYRVLVAQQIGALADSILSACSGAQILVAGDFNDYAHTPALDTLASHKLTDVAGTATGRHGARGTYRYRGDWGSLDHILCSPQMAGRLHECYIGDLPFLMEEDTKYGGVKPFRTFLGPTYHRGYSDHLPLVARFRTKEDTPAETDRQ